MICKICISSDILGHNNSRQNKMEKERIFMAGSQKNKNQEYLDYVNRTSPKSPMLKNMLLAFLFGGLICVIGQAFGDL